MKQLSNGFFLFLGALLLSGISLLQAQSVDMSAGSGSFQIAGTSSLSTADLHLEVVLPVTSGGLRLITEAEAYVFEYEEEDDEPSSYRKQNSSSYSPGLICYSLSSFSSQTGLLLYTRSLEQVVASANRCYILFRNFRI